jgi:hypothetical protein
MFRRSNRDRPILTVHTGDTHVGSTVALMPPQVELDSGGTYVASREQRWYWDCWLRFWDDVAALKKEHAARVLAVSGGDQREGDHHDTTQIWFESDADQDRGVELVYEVAGDVVDEWVFVRGTESHDGPMAAATERYAKWFASKGWNVRMNGHLYSWFIWTGVVGGVKFQEKHEPQTKSWVPHTRDVSASRQAQYTWTEYATDWIEPPDIAVWHHVHYRAKGWHNGTFCYVCPAWQLRTAWATNRASSPRVERPGGVCFLCEDGNWRPFELGYKPESSVAWAT